MNIAKSRRKLTWKYCALPGCQNRFLGSQFERYCRDERCLERRREIWKDNRKKRRKRYVKINRVLPKSKFSRKIPTGYQLRLRCKATDKNGNRCENTYVIRYDSRREVYPKYCEEHANRYRRERFKLQNAEDKITRTRQIL